jgi:tetratricopeptide (TPR) repeat protein
VLLDDASRALVAEHEVRLDAKSWQQEAFADLGAYLRWHMAPDRAAEDEAQVLDEVGAWIGSQVLGPISDALVERRPATVRVVVPPAAEALLFRPLELAHAGGKPLSVQDVTFVMEVGTTGVPNPAPVGERLRVLGLFSLPEGGKSLNLRRERQALVRLIQGIASAGKAVDVRVLQYGVTRDRLRGLLEEAEGWDIVHVSGHGTPGELVLETPAGKPDRIPAAELADLLDPARPRLKLVTVAACWSAAVSTAEQRRRLGLPVHDEGNDPEPAVPETGTSTGATAGSVATKLAQKLGCAVLAMRYPVDDEFAAALTVKLYDLLARQGQPLPRAVGVMLRQLLAASGPDGAESADAGPGVTRYPALSAATPALFGGKAVDLRLAAPDRHGPVDYGTAALKTVGFPPQPSRFVGRTAVMARSSAALAAGSRVPGVLLHGMPGGGKTACALELAYGHEHAFDQLAWYKAPDEGMDISGALTDFALTLERYLPGFQLAHVLASRKSLAGFLPRLTGLAEQRRVLIIIDNAESLLTEGGQWRDGDWSQVVGALTAHRGLGRLIMTSRRVPVGLTGPRAEPIDALSADEALLLARELPHFRALMDGKTPPLKPYEARQLARRALTVAQGHPKLLELADGQAGNPVRLARLVQAADEAWLTRGGVPEGFFTTGETTATTDDYVRILAIWTKEVTAAITPGERDLFWFLCGLSEPDRERAVLEANWAGLWRRLGRGGEPPALDQALSTLSDRGLAASRTGADDVGQRYTVHPGIAAAGHADAGRGFHDAVDAQVAVYWDAMFRYASGEVGDEGVNTVLLVRAGMAAVPYLVRQGRWTVAAGMLERAFNEDPSRLNAAAMLPAVRQMTEHDPSLAGVLARILHVIDPATAASQMRAFREDAVARGDYRAASVITGELINHCRSSGLLAEALTLANEMAGFSREAGLGPWTQLSDEVQRLQVLSDRGEEVSEVLSEVWRLRDRMLALPPPSDPDEATTPWSVRETLFGTGRDAAAQLGRWDDALRLNAQVIGSERERRALPAEIARSRFNDYGALLALDRTEEALEVLQECRQSFQDARDFGSLGKTLGAIALIEDARGHGDATVQLRRDALRYVYLAGDADGIAVGYHDLGNYFHLYPRLAAAAINCHLAAALISVLAGTGGAGDSVHNVSVDLRELGAAVLPADVADLCRQLDDIPGTDLPGLIAALSPDLAAAEHMLRALIAQAQELAVASPAEASSDLA